MLSGRLPPRLGEGLLTEGTTCLVTARPLVWRGVLLELLPALKCCFWCLVLSSACSSCVVVVCAVVVYCCCLLYIMYVCACCVSTLHRVAFLPHFDDTYREVSQLMDVSVL